MGKGITKKQATAAKHVKTLMKVNKVDTPLAVPRDQLNAAVREAYDLHGEEETKVSAYTSELLKSHNFKAALGFDCSATKQFVGSHIVNNLKGTNTTFPDADNDTKLALYLASLKIAATHSFESKKTVDVNVSHHNRSDEELEFFVKHGHWQTTIEGN